MASPVVAPGRPGGPEPLLELGAPKAGLVRGLPRPLLAVHLGTLVVGFVVWLYLDRHLWFYGDAWDFIVRRGILHPQVNLWVPHNEHWSTLPILLWRAIFAVVHLSHYWPYLAALLVVHVAIVHLFWRRCLLEGTDPWVATAIGLLLALLGSGAEDLTWAFQVGFLGSVAFGLIALELAEVERSTPAKAVLAPLAAIASLMCSAIGVAMVVSLAVLALARRGWRRAAALVAPPATVFGAWYLTVGYKGVARDHISAAGTLRTPRFVWHDVTSDVARVFSLNTVDLAVLTPALVVCLLAWLAWGFRRLVRRHPAVLALLAGDLAFHVMTALARERFGDRFSPSRYVYIDAVLLLPGFAVALRGFLSWAIRVPAKRLPFARVSRLGAAPTGGLRLSVVGLLVACTVGNVFQGVWFAHSRTNFVLLEKQQIEGAAQLLAGGQKAITGKPIRYSGLTTGDMLRLAHEHLLPTTPMTAAERGIALTVLDVTVSARRLVPGKFALLGMTGGAAWRTTAPGCLTVWARPHAPLPRLELRPAGHDRSAAVHFAARAGTLRSFLTPRWPPSVGQPYVGLKVPSGGGWVSDAVPSYNLVLDVPPGRSTFCELSGPTSEVGPAVAGRSGR